MAAPLTPRRKANINIGSKIIFVTSPATKLDPINKWVIINWSYQAHIVRSKTFYFFIIIYLFFLLLMRKREDRLWPVCLTIFWNFFLYTPCTFGQWRSQEFSSVRVDINAYFFFYHQRIKLRKEIHAYIFSKKGIEIK